VRQPQVDPDLGISLRQRLGVDLDDERGEVPSGRVPDHRDRGGLRRQRPGPAHRHLPDLRQGQLPARRDPEPGVAGEPDRLPAILAGPKPQRGHLRPLSLARYRGEEVPVGGVQVGHGLLQHHRGHLGKPGTLGIFLRLGDDLAHQGSVRDVGQPGQAQALAKAVGCARVVFNDALAARQESLSFRTGRTSKGSRPCVSCVRSIIRSAYACRYASQGGQSGKRGERRESIASVNQ